MHQPAAARPDHDVAEDDPAIKPFNCCGKLLADGGGLGAALHAHPGCRDVQHVAKATPDILAAHSAVPPPLIGWEFILGVYITHAVGEQVHRTGLIDPDSARLHPWRGIEQLPGSGGWVCNEYADPAAVGMHWALYTFVMANAPHAFYPRFVQSAPLTRWKMARLVAVMLLAGAAGGAEAQLSIRESGRQYFGVGRTIALHVDAPAKPAPGAAGEPAQPQQGGEMASDVKLEPVIDLYRWGDAAPMASAAVVPGGVDLSGLFPQLWADRANTVYFAQLRVGNEQVGSPLVLSPMVTPRRAVLYNPKVNQAWFVNPKTGLPSFDARKECELEFLTPAINYAGLRIDVAQMVTFVTSLGEITFLLRWDQAPMTCHNLVELVGGGFYNEIAVHRVVAKLPTGHPFVVQFGDPTGTGDGGPGFNIQMEHSRLAHDFGVLSMARDDDPDTNGSQVFICLSREGTARLDGKYTSFAQAINGADVIMALSAVKTDAKTQRPIDPVPTVKSARLDPAPPFTSWPKPVMRPAATGR